MGILIKTNGQALKITPKSGSKFTLEELQGYVGGYIERIELRGRFMLVNEEGKIFNLKPNTRATMLATQESAVWDIIRGDVVVLNYNEVD